MEYLILTTQKGANFSRAISRDLRRKLHGSGHVYRYRVTAIDEFVARHPEVDPRNLIIHCRAAHPTARWMDQVQDLVTRGARIINALDVLRLTSDKFAFWVLANRAGIATEDSRTILTTKLNRRATPRQYNDLREAWVASGYTGNGVVIKPQYSQGQGQFVTKITWDEFCNPFRITEVLDSMPRMPVIVQEIIPYIAIYRVVVINGVSLPTGIVVDYPTSEDWKVSVCLGQRKRAFDYTTNLPLANRLCVYAETIQLTLAGEVNFIDIFDTGRGLVVSEVNTACNLNSHARLTGVNFASEIADYLLTARIN